MKKLLLLAAVLGAAIPLFGQSSVTFANTSSTLIQTNNLQGNIGNVLFNPALVTYQLLVGPAGATDSSTFTVLASVGNSTSVAGRFFGGTVVNNAVAPGAVMAVQVRGFIGADWASATWRGQTAVLDVDGGDPTAVPAGTPAATFGTGLLQSFQITPVPEPSSIALGLLGLGAVALFRRKK